MEEKYLHLIWEMKRLPSNDLLTVDGVRIEILSFGIRNDDLAGPDFFYAKVRYDGITHFGMIEIHVKSYDWYRHRHQFDRRYDNVILHVVHEYDKPIIQSGYELPTIELNPFIDAEHYLKFKQGRLNSLTILCRNQIHSIPSIYLESMKSRVLIEKLTKKVEYVSNIVGSDPKDILYGLLTLSFGTGKNKNGFERILQHLPRQKVYDNGQLSKHIYVFQAEAILNEYKKTSEWNYKGLRPKGNPEVRFKQLVNTLESIDLDLISGHSSFSLFEKEIQKFLNIVELTSFMKDQLIINLFAPYLWSVGMHRDNEDFKQNTLDLLSKVKAENNKITRKWKNQDIELKTAYDSQALLGLYRYYCSAKKCLSCQVGLKLSNS